VSQLVVRTSIQGSSSKSAWSGPGDQDRCAGPYDEVGYGSPSAESDDEVGYGSPAWTVEEQQKVKEHHLMVRPCAIAPAASPMSAAAERAAEFKRN
jgi:hypothetical protein